MLILCLLTSGWASADLGDRPMDWTNPMAQDFSDLAIRSLNKQRALTNDYWATYWLSQKILQLNLVNPRPTALITPLIMREDSINAFAIPGNIIGLHTGLWRFASSESEFLSVLAHEMSHIALDHFSRLSANQSQQGWVIASGILLTILLAQENPEAANAALFSTFAVTSQNQLNFSQTMELEADQLAQSLLAAAGYNGNGGRAFFQKLEQTSFTTDAYEFLRSHPLGSTRASRLTNRTSSRLEPASAGPSASAFDVIRFNLLQGADPSLANPLAGWTELPDSINDPNLILAWYKIQNQREPDDRGYLTGITSLMTQYRGFLPAYFEQLKVMQRLKDTKLCNNVQPFATAIENSYATLDVLELLQQVSAQCGLGSAVEWQARWLWQSGKETQAMVLLSNRLDGNTDTNQIARLKTLLKDYNGRYRRFR
ncbi:MAG: Zn-dependent protease with chaperone function [Reinekea sp.]|jgi:Zn-dependent protease with chaperone function